MGQFLSRLSEHGYFKSRSLPQHQVCVLLQLRPTASVDQQGSDRRFAPGLQPIANARNGPDQRNFISEGGRHSAHRFIFLASEEQVLDLPRFSLKTHTPHQLGVKVTGLGPHTTNIQGQAHFDGQ